MATVQTVLGPVDPADLGPTLVHEHISFSYPGDHFDPRSTWDRARCIETAVRRMEGLREHGIRTVVDPTPMEMGRDPELIAEVSQRSGVNIVCATGFYHDHGAIGIPYYWRVRSAEEIAELYLHEINEGILGTGIRPGVIKMATGQPPTELDEKVVHAAAMAAAAANITVITHCENATFGDRQQDILAEHGVDLRRVVIGHQGQASDTAQHVAIAERGSMVGFDRIGLEILVPDDTQADFIAALVQEGHADHIVLSQDHMCCLRSARFPYPIPPGMEELEKVALHQMVGREHTYLMTEFLPRLRERGVDDKLIDRFLVDNPRRLFGG